MIAFSPFLEGLQIEAQDFYRHTIRVLHEKEVPFLIGGAYALAYYTGIIRHTKDFDIFVRPPDCQRVLDALSEAGYQTELIYPHWLGKAHRGDDLVDVIFSSGNGVAKVDDAWFEHSAPASFLGEPVRIVPAEETLWSKAYICERERYDGADINHLLRAHGADLDWQRVLRRFGPHWRVLLSHLVLFGFVYPSERDRIPNWVMQQLLRGLQAEQVAEPSTRKVCQGTLLSRVQYIIDLDQWGYQDARLDAEAGMSRVAATAWTEAGLTQ